MKHPVLLGLGVAAGGLYLYGRHVMGVNAQNLFARANTSSDPVFIGQAIVALRASGFTAYADALQVRLNSLPKAAT